MDDYAQRIAEMTASWTLDTHTRTMRGTKAFYGLLGLQPTDSDLPFDNFLSFIIPTDQPRVRNVFSDSTLNQEPFIFKIKDAADLPKTLICHIRIFETNPTDRQTTKMSGTIEQSPNFE